MNKIWKRLTKNAMSNCKNTCAQCGCKDMDIPAFSPDLIGQGKPKDKVQICPSKKQLATLKKQEARRAEIRQHNVEALKEHIKSAKFISVFCACLLVLPAALFYALWHQPDAAFWIAVCACIACTIIAAMGAVLSNYRASDLQMFSDILEDMDSSVDETLQP
jgi:hypothetical protein